MINIALAFSGGGYRAAAFNLGTLSFLNEVNMGDERLLEKVSVLSTVSGGTITGARYAIGLQRKESFSEIYQSLYTFMEKADLVNASLENLIDAKNWKEGRVQSLINAIADVYDKELFAGALFGELMTEQPETYLRHMSFNATEFATALQFRFQWSERIIQPKTNEADRGLIGNYNYRVPQDVAAQIRMADILAASSCFPGGFEPINFPTDFIIGKKEVLHIIKDNKKFPVGLMDGGIVDNQGIEPVLLANERMMRNRNSLSGNEETAYAIDLVIISDVASPYMEEYKASIQKPKNWWRRLTLGKLALFNGAFLLVCLSLLVFFFIKGNVWMSSIMTSFFTLSILLFCLILVIKSVLKSSHVPTHFLKPLQKLAKLKLLVYENMIANRVDSILKMTNNVFLKHVRRLNYRSIYQDTLWKNRRIMNAIYELKTGEEKLQEKVRRGELSDYLIPTEAIQKVVEKSSSMATTLWFSKEEIDGKMLDALIACGQFTMCWNLLEYIEKMIAKPGNTSAAHETICSLELQLKELWLKFQENPYWMIERSANVK